MRFAREANDYGFSFCKEKGSYNLKDWNQVAKFAEEILCEWDDHFQLEFSEEAALLKKGIVISNGRSPRAIMTHTI